MVILNLPAIRYQDFFSKYTVYFHWYCVKVQEIIWFFTIFKFKVLMTLINTQVTTPIPPAFLFSIQHSRTNLNHNRGCEFHIPTPSPDKKINEHGTWKSITLQLRGICCYACKLRLDHVMWIPVILSIFHESEDIRFWM